MQSKLLQDQGEKTFALIFDTGDEFMENLTRFARQNHLDASHFTAIGAFSEVILGFFDMDKKEYKKIPVKEQVEVLSLIGDIALDNGQPKVHAHVVIGDAEGRAMGGHNIQANVQPTLELILIETPSHLRRTTDPKTGLALIYLRDGAETRR
jgi:predicted DNA-binding protein with PD1-like motif